ncbi:MAG: hypothetical protein NZ699_15310 [Roseiflexus sp.]|nr:hypothetical protein [Roseiflexus sp.]MCS7290499.1 hypothetical protein [Roseiflexus sp.]MDW8148360.1 hypothetical protein [Roseiflexaceae bacterium]MDW8232294.1 hypothetical protein [Roseiflexaceae bacterium]
MSSDDYHHTDPLRDMLLRSGALKRREPTIDLVASTMRRLPQAPPRVVAQRAAARRLLSRAVAILALVLLIVPATLGALNLMRGVETPMGALASAAGQANMRAAILAATGQRFDDSLIRGLVAVLVWLMQMAVIVLTVGFWPRRSAVAGMTLRAAPLRALGTGVLALGALGIVSALLLALLTATVIGLPIAVGVALLAHVPVALGIAITARTLGWHLFGHYTPHNVDGRLAATAAVLALPAALGTLVSLPAALLTLYLLAVPGIGALILSQGGMQPVVGLGIRG